MLNGEPLIFHNIHGKVHINRLSAITSIGAWPVWVKAGVSSSILPSSLNPTGAWQQLKSTVLGLF
jgi:hypothetical protein